jgi:hypothetical protein
MLNTLVRITVVALVHSICATSLARADEDEISSKALSILKTPLSTVRVAAESAPFYAVPDARNDPLWSFDWMANLMVDERRMTDAPKGWIAIREIAAVKGREDYIPSGWIRRRDVVIPGDYKKVIGCWPVKSVTYVAGDYAVEATFKTDGSALVKEWGDEEWINRQPPHKAYVYMARNIVTIEASKKNGPVFFTSGYRPAERKLYPEGAPGKEQELFPEALLKDCPSIPILAK